MSLFGATQNKPASLFGNSFGASTTTLQPPAQNSLFGGQALAQQTTTPTTGLFGSLGQSQSQPQSTGLFANPQPAQQINSFGQPAQNTGLFGQSNQSTGLFGNAGQQNNAGAPTQGGLFGSTLQQPAQTTSLFGQQPQNSLFSQNQAQNPGQTSMFGQPQQNSLFGQTQQQATASTFGASPQQSRPVWQNSSIQPRKSPAKTNLGEKTVPEQMQTLLEKWSPDSSTCLFQHYFYNHVNPETIPYYGPENGEDPTKWEEALSKRPGEDAIPVLCRGFAALGNRLRIQVQSVSALQTRLHEINNSLTEMLQLHDVDISVRAADAKRRHVALSQRSLRLATKIQILRNRGYALDGAEEALRKSLLELERKAFDPRLNGRQEEIWARMSMLRDRAQALQEETARLAVGSPSKNAQIDGETLKRASKILNDYDSQITHLSRELASIKADFGDWERSVSRD